jgi:hypothetical protein
MMYLNSNYMYGNREKYYKDYKTNYNFNSIVIYCIFIGQNIIKLHLMQFIIKLINEQIKTADCSLIPKHALKRRQLKQNAKA